ncbi:MAG: extracellular solute-binding protein [Anaerolineales bacterium]
MSGMTRRRLLQLGLVGAGAIALAACAPEVAEEEPIVEVEEPEEEAPEPAGDAITLRFLTRQGDMGIHHREFASRYEDSTDGRVTVESEEVPWDEVLKTLMTQYVTGTMVDLTWGDNAWFPRLGAAGAMLVIEPYVEASDMDLSRWFNLEWFRKWTDGELSGLGGCAGCHEIVTFYDKEWVTEAWGKEPEDDWTLDEWWEMQVACVDFKGGPGNGHFAEPPVTGGGHGAHAYYARWNKEDVDKGFIDREGKTSLFNSEPTQEGIQFVIKGLQDGYFPGREDLHEEGWFPMFMGGMLPSFTSNPGASSGMVEGSKENDIDLGVVLGPCGPTCEPPHEVRIHTPYTNMFGIYSGTEHPEESFELMRMVSSEESMTWLCLETGKQPGAQLDSWYDERIVEKFPWFPKIADLMLESEEKGTSYFPMAANTRYGEWTDVGNNEIPPLIYGDIEYNQSNIDMINDRLQEIIDLPMPESS